METQVVPKKYNFNVTPANAYMENFTVQQFELKILISTNNSFLTFQLLLIGSLTTGLLLLPVFYYLTLVR